MNKRGLSDIVTNVLIILIVLVAVGIIWVFIQPFLFNAGGSLTTGQYDLSLEIVPQSVRINETTKIVNLTVKRNEGGQDLVGFNVILKDSTGAERAFRFNLPLAELETRTVSINYTGNLTGTITVISVAPIFLNQQNTEVIAQPTSSFNVNTGLVNNQGSGPPPNNPVCGNSIIESGEQCDLGNGNGVNAACSVSCQFNPINIALLSPNTTFSSYNFSWINSTTGTPRRYLLNFTASSYATSCWYNIDATNHPTDQNVNLTIPSCVPTTFNITVNGTTTLRVYASNGIGLNVTNSHTFRVNKCPGDLTGDGIYDFLDINAYLSHPDGVNCVFGSPCYAGDANGDTVVDFVDLNVILGSISSGQTCQNNQ